MTRDKIIALVKVKMEELTPFSEGLVVLQNNNVKPITSYIDTTLDEATETMLMILPLHLLTPKSLGGQYSISNEIGYINLPADFIRIYAIKLTSWEREINKATLVTDPEYVLQSNPHTKGKSVKPVVVLNNSTTVKRLELYSPLNSSDTLVKDFYVANEKPELLPDSLIKYIVLMTAIKVYNIIERPDTAKVLENELKLIIEASK